MASFSLELLLLLLPPAAAAPLLWLLPQFLPNGLPIQFSGACLLVLALGWPLAVPVLANVTASEANDPETVRRLLVEQVTGRVRWRESIGWMAENGVTETWEIGAGKALSGMVKRIAREINIPFTVGGGISELKDADALLSAGADKISINSSAVRNPKLIDDLALNFGSQFVVLAIDARGENDYWTVTVNGGRIPTDKELFSWAKEGESRGAGEILFTSMNHDGTKAGFANKELAKMADMLRIPIIASGGAGNMEHFVDVFTEGKADAGLAASIFHYKEIPIPDVKSYLRTQGIVVR